MTPDPEAAKVLDDAYSHLVEHGWVCGRTRVGEQLCVGAAIRMVTPDPDVGEHALIHLARVLSPHSPRWPVSTIVNWNDTLGRTLDEVLDALTKAAHNAREGTE